MTLPKTRSQLLKRIAVETARMSYPGSMSRGKRPIVLKGTKARLEAYFGKQFPLAEIWKGALNIRGYERWHRRRVADIAKCLAGNVRRPNKPESVAAKFLNTFMHQLMKYAECRALLPALHLPLDTRVFMELSSLASETLKSIRSLLTESSPYRLPYPRHIEVQRALKRLIAAFNRQPDAEFQIRSRVELNSLLWAHPGALPARVS